MIEKEISRIQEETQVLQQKVPDKPPPPYTPPAPIKVTKALQPVKYVPSSKQQIIDYSDQLLNKMMEMRSHSEDTAFILDADVPVTEESGSKGMYVGFLFDLVREIVNDVYSVQCERQNPVWMPQKPLRKMKMSIPRTDQRLMSGVHHELKILFGFERRAQRENLIVRWSPQKRRDRVDQILVRELHAEETAWTDFSKDETEVKDNVSSSLMDLLIDDTVAALKKVYNAELAEKK